MPRIQTKYCIPVTVFLIVIVIWTLCTKTDYSILKVSLLVADTNSGGCIIPETKVFTLESKLMFRRRQEWKCPKGLPPIVKVLPENTIAVDHAVLKKYYNYTELRRCEYVPITRGNKGISELPDDAITFEKTNKVAFVNEVKVDHEFIKIVCIDTKGKVLFSEFKAFILKEKIKVSHHKSGDSLNLLILGVDSVSRMNFLRHFPRTNAILKNLGSISLEGYNKVQLNTMVNMVPLLTGKHAKDFINSSIPSYFDDVPLIWKQFSRAGYATMFAEDGPRMGMFHYGNNGFKSLPTDYYFRPFSVAVDLSAKKKKGKKLCIGSKLEAELVFDWVAEFIEKFKDDRYFALGYTSTLTHDDFNDAGYADYPLERLFKRLYLQDTDLMNRTALVFISDHGLQVADETLMDPYAWELEERLPFAHIVLPKWFLNLNKEIQINLKRNQRQLTSPFDIHETLVNILQLNEVGLYSPNSGTFGKSLFQKIASGRKCGDIGISDHYCACHKYKPVDLKDQTVQEAALRVVIYINDLTNHAREKCSLLFLDKIVNSKIRLHKGKNEFYRLNVLTKPNNGSFESTVRYNTDTKTSEIVDGGITRVNRYRNQSSCISERQLFPFCYCH